MGGLNTSLLPLQNLIVACGKLTLSLPSLIFAIAFREAAALRLFLRLVYLFMLPYMYCDSDLFDARTQRQAGSLELRSLDSRDPAQVDDALLS